MYLNIINTLFDTVSHRSTVVLLGTASGILLLLFILIKLKLGLIGCFFFSTNDPLTSLVSLIGSMVLVVLLIWLLPLFLGEQVPLSLDIAALAGSLFLPMSILLVIVWLFESLPIFHVLGSLTVIFIELLTLYFWGLWIYLIFRKRIGMEEKNALISTLVINTCFLVIGIVVMQF